MQKLNLLYNQIANSKILSMRTLDKMRRSRMTIMEELKLSPIQKLFLYDKIPWKFIVTVLMITTSTVQEYNEYNLAVRGTLYSTFFPDGFDYQEENLPVFVSSSFIYKFEDLQDSLKKVVHQYYDIVNTSVGDFLFVTNEQYEYTKDKNQAMPILMEVNKYNSELPLVLENSNYFLTENDYLGPFTERINQILSELVMIRLRFSLVTADASSNMFWKWNIDIKYDGTSKGGRLQMMMNFYPEYAYDIFENMKRLSTQSLLFYNNFLIVFFSLWYLILNVKQVLSRFRLYMKVRKRFKSRNVPSLFPWKEVSQRLIDRLFFRWYLLFGFIAVVCNILGSILNYNLAISENQSDSINWRRLFIGIGCAFSWVSITRFTEFDTKYYVLINTLKTGLPNILRSLFAVAPIFLGYALFGVAYFSQSTPKFYNLDNACVVLFAIANGDIIQDTYTELYHASPIVSRLFLYSFISLFIYVVLNMLIQIMQEGYKIARFIGNPDHEHKKFKYTHGYKPLEDQIWQEISFAGGKDWNAHHTHPMSVDDIDSLNEDLEPFCGPVINEVLEEHHIDGIIDKSMVESSVVSPDSEESAKDVEIEPVIDLVENLSSKELREDYQDEAILKMTNKEKVFASATKLFKAPLSRADSYQMLEPQRVDTIRESFMADVEKAINKRHEAAMAETIEHVRYLVNDYFKVQAAARGKPKESGFKEAKK